VTQSLDKDSKVVHEQLLAVAKQAVAAACSIKPEDVRIDEDGEIGFDHNGSGVVFLGAETDYPRYTFRSLVLDSVKIEPKVYEYVNAINVDIVFGAFHVEKEAIWFYYCLPVDRPTPDLVRFAMDMCVSIVDDYDDRLKALVGGERFVETADDEIEV